MQSKIIIKLFFPLYNTTDLPDILTATSTDDTAISANHNNPTIISHFLKQNLDKIATKRAN